MLAGTTVENGMILLEQSCIAHMPLHVVTSAFKIGRSTAVIISDVIYFVSLLYNTSHTASTRVLADILYLARVFVEPDWKLRK